MNKDDLVSIRGLHENDTNFILSTFLKALYHGKSPYSEMFKNDFMINYVPIIRNLLDPEVSTIRVACLKEDPEVILSYAILNKDETSVHFAFCKRVWRSVGITRSLIPTTVKSATHYTKVGLIIMRKKGWNFNPFAV